MAPKKKKTRSSVVKREPTPPPPKPKHEQDLETIQSMWEFAAFTQFCSVFRSALGLPAFFDEDLEEALVYPVGNVLIAELHIKFLKALSVGRPASITTETWQKVLRNELNNHTIEICGDENPMQTEAGEPIAYEDVSAEIRVIILLEMCHWLLDTSVKVIEAVGEMPPEDIRGDPLGYDKDNNTYFWFGERRLYRETPVRLGGGKKSQEMYLGDWQIVCTTKEDWESLADRLSKSRNKDEKFLSQQIQEIMPMVNARFAAKAKKQRLKVVPEWLPPKRSARIQTKQEEIKQQKEEQERLEREEKARKREYSAFLSGRPARTVSTRRRGAIDEEALLELTAYPKKRRTAGSDDNRENGESADFKGKEKEEDDSGSENEQESDKKTEGEEKTEGDEGNKEAETTSMEEDKSTDNAIPIDKSQTDNDNNSSSSSSSSDSTSNNNDGVNKSVSSTTDIRSTNGDETTANTTTSSDDVVMTTAETDQQAAS